MSFPIDTLLDLFKSVHSAGSFDQTLAVSVSGSVPLPSGAATAAKQDTGNASLASIDSKLTNPLPVSGTVTANAGTGNFTVVQSTAANLNATVVGTGTFAVQATQAGTWNINNISGTISLPTGASTSALQTTGNTSLSSIDSKTPALGQALAAASVPVVLTAAQLSTLTPLSTVAVTQSTSPWVVSNGGTFAVQAAQSGTWNITNISGTISLPTGAATETTLAKLPLTQGSTTSGQSGVLIQGAVTTAAPSYTTAQTSPLSLTTAGALRTDSSATTQPISGTVTVTQATGTNLHTVLDSGTLTSITNALPAGTNLLGKVGIDQTTPGTTNRVDATIAASQTLATVTTVSTVTSLTQMNGQAIAMGTGVRTAGTQRVTIATDDVVPASQSGTWTVQPGNTANTTPWLVTSNTGTTGGMSFYRNSALSNTATAVKASAGNLYYYHIYNTNSADAFLQLYNVAAGSVTVGTTTPDLTLAIPGGGLLDGSFDGSPFSFGTAITVAATTTITGGTAPSTGLLIAIGFK